jgi:autotransporter translocation and assembly factor TamB
VLSLSALYALRDTLIAPRLSAWLSAEIESQLGLRVSIGRISGTYFNAITIENLTTIESAIHRPLANLDLKRLKVNYSLLALFGGVTNLIATSTLDVHQADLTLDWTLPARSSASGEEQQARLPVALPPPEMLPRINLVNSSLKIRAANLSSVFENIDLKLLQPDPDNRHMDLTVATWRWDLTDFTRGSAPIALKLKYTRDELVLESLIIGEQGLHATGKIGLNNLTRSFPFAVACRLAGAPIAITGTVASNALNADFQADRLDLSVLTAGVTSSTYTASGALSLRGNVHMPLNRPQGFNCDLTINLQDGKYRGMAIENLKAAIAAKEGSIQIQQLNLVNAENRFFIRDMLLPAELVYAPTESKSLRGLKGNFNFDLKDVPSVLDMIGWDVHRIAPDIPAHRLLLDGRIQKDGVIGVEGELLINGNSIHLEPSQITLPLTEFSLDATKMDVRLKADFTNLGVLSQVSPIPLIGGQLQGDILIAGSFASPRGRIRLNAKEVAFKEIFVGNVVAEITSDGHRIAAEKVEIFNGDDTVKISGAYHIDTRTFDDARLNLKVGKIQTYLHLWPTKSYPLQGELDVTVAASGPLSAPDVNLVASSRAMQIGNFTLTDINLKASNTKGRLHIEQAEACALRGRLHLAGTLQYDPGFTEFEAHLTKLSIFREDIDLHLMEPTRIRFARTGVVQVANLLLAGSAGKIQLNAKLALDGSSDLNLRVMGFTGKRWMAEVFGQGVEFESLDAHGHLKGRLTAPQVDLTGQVNTLRSPYLPVPLTGKFDLAYDNRALRFRQFDWSGEDGYHISVTGTVPIPRSCKAFAAADALSLNAAVQLPDMKILNMLVQKELVTAGALNANLQIAGTWQKPVGRLHFKTQGLELVDDLGPLPPGSLEIDSDIQYEDGKISIRTLNLQAPAFSFTGKGVWRNGPTPAILCNSPGEPLSGEIAFDGKATASDLNWLADGIPEIRKTGGRLEAQFKAHGPVHNPRVSATLNLNDGELRLQMDLPALQAIQLQAAITPDKFDIQLLQGLLGGASINLQGTLGAVFTANPLMDLRAWGENLLLYRSQGLRVRADTDLVLRGPLDKMKLTGNMAVTEGRFSQYLDILGQLQSGGAPKTISGIQLFSIHDPPFRDMGIDVQITSKGSFQVRNNLIRGEMRPDLQLTGTGEVPVLLGKIYIDMARFRLPSGTVAIENGVVQFTQSDPNRPVLNLVGTCRALGYDITMLVEGSYDEPTITLNSSPPLSNEDLLMLVLSGTPPSSANQTIDKQARNLNVAVYIGRDMIERWFSSDNGASTESILDRFEVEVGRNITQKGEESLETRFRLTKGVFRKNDTIYIIGEKDVFDYYNAGVRIVFRFR